jgi:SAM-dependent methyltransferase
MVTKQRALEIQAPWTAIQREDCDFYHSLDLPGGVHIDGAWDLRGQFVEYVGGVSVAGKSVLDVGTAGGFLAFEAERHGAKLVVAHELESLLSFDRVPFKGGPAWVNKREWVSVETRGLDRQKSGFWFAWRMLKSRAQVIYGSISDLLSYDESFDIVFAGALMEHLADPVTAVGACCRLAKETVVIGFTPVIDSDEELMRPLIEWANPVNNYVWWAASRGLYRRVFTNMGFEINVLPCNIPRGAVLWRVARS